MKALSSLISKKYFLESAFLVALALTLHHTVRRLESHRVSCATSSACETHVHTQCTAQAEGRNGGQNVSQRSESSSSPLGDFERGDFFMSGDGCPRGTTFVAGGEHQR